MYWHFVNVVGSGLRVTLRNFHEEAFQQWAFDCKVNYAAYNYHLLIKVAFALQLRKLLSKGWLLQIAFSLRSSRWTQWFVLSARRRASGMLFARRPWQTTKKTLMTGRMKWSRQKWSKQAFRFSQLWFDQLAADLEPNCRHQDKILWSRLRTSHLRVKKNKGWVSLQLPHASPFSTFVMTRRKFSLSFS